MKKVLLWSAMIMAVLMSFGCSGNLESVSTKFNKQLPLELDYFGTVVRTYVKDAGLNIVLSISEKDKDLVIDHIDDENEFMSIFLVSAMNTKEIRALFKKVTNITGVPINVEITYDDDNYTVASSIRGGKSEVVGSISKDEIQYVEKIGKKELAESQVITYFDMRRDYTVKDKRVIREFDMHPKGELKYREKYIRSQYKEYLADVFNEESDEIPPRLLEMMESLGMNIHVKYNYNQDKTLEYDIVLSDGYDKNLESANRTATAENTSKTVTEADWQFAMNDVKQISSQLPVYISGLTMSRIHLDREKKLLQYVYRFNYNIDEDEAKERIDAAKAETKEVMDAALNIYEDRFWETISKAGVEVKYVYYNREGKSLGGFSHKFN